MQVGQLTIADGQGLQRQGGVDVINGLRFLFLSSVLFSAAV